MGLCRLLITPSTARRSRPVVVQRCSTLTTPPTSPRSCGTVRKVPATARATRSNSRYQRLPMARSTLVREGTTSAELTAAPRFPANWTSMGYSRSKSRLYRSWAGMLKRSIVPALPNTSCTGESCTNISSAATENPLPNRSQPFLFGVPSGGKHGQRRPGPTSTSLREILPRKSPQPWLGWCKTESPRDITSTQSATYRFCAR